MKKKKKDKPMLMDALSRLSNSDTIEKPKPIFQNSWKSVWDISVHNLTFERIPFKKKKFSYRPILFQNVKKNFFPCKYVYFLRKKSQVCM